MSAGVCEYCGASGAQACDITKHMGGEGAFAAYDARTQVLADRGGDARRIERLVDEAMEELDKANRCERCGDPLFGEGTACALCSIWEAP